MKLRFPKKIETYRYGFNGYENDDEVKGNGNHLDFGNFGYDTRLGRRWNIDPVVKHHESPYATFANNPIWFADENGMDTLKMHLKEIKDIGTVKVFKMTFSYVKDGLERELDLTLTAGAHSAFYDGQIRKEKYKLENNKMGSHPEWDNTIQVRGAYTKYEKPQREFAIFFHQTNTPSGNLGCITCTKNPIEPFMSGAYFEDTETALNEIQSLYKKVDGENGNLTGDKFVLYIDSEAKDVKSSLQRFESIGAKQIEVSVEKDIQTEEK